MSEEIRKEKTKLTLRQEKFCLEYAKTGNAVQSFLKAYNKPKSGYNSAGAESSRLLKNIKIQRRLKEIHETHDKEKIMQIEEMKEKLTKLARDFNDKKSSLKAMELLAKIGGFFINRQELEIKNSVPIILKDDL